MTRGSRRRRRGLVSQGPWLLVSAHLLVANGGGSRVPLWAQPAFALGHARLVVQRFWRSPSFCFPNAPLVGLGRSRCGVALARRWRCSARGSRARPGCASPGLGSVVLAAPFLPARPRRAAFSRRPTRAPPRVRLLRPTPRAARLRRAASRSRPASPSSCRARRGRGRAASSSSRRGGAAPRRASVAACCADKPRGLGLQALAGRPTARS